MVDLWHKRMGHLNMQSLKHAEKVVLGLPKLDVSKGKLCEGCALGKHHRFPFPKSDKKTTRALELVHSDICDPMSMESFGGSLYFLTFIDDFSKKTWIYFLKRKSECHEKFVQWKQMVENETRYRMKVFRSDNGGEYRSKAFDSTFKRSRIKREYTIPYTPQ